MQFLSIGNYKMSNEEHKDLELQFKELKESMSSEEWSNSRYLKKISRNLEKDNLALSVKILQRVRRLNKLEQKRLTKKIKLQSNRLDVKKEHSEAENNGEAELLNDEPELLRKNSIDDKNSVSTPNQKPASNELKNDKDNDDSNDDESLRGKHWLISKVSKPIYICVLLPFLVFTFYQIVWASPRYESHSQLIVKQPDAAATMDAGMAILSGLGVQPTSTDSKLVEAYIYSANMLEYIDETLSIKEHYESSDADIFSRLEEGSSKEDFLTYYKEHVTVEIDEKSKVITLYTQGFTPEFAQSLNQLIVNRAEWFINQVSNNLASEQLKFINGEHERAENRLRKIQTNLLSFQRKYGLLDPEVESIALQKITYSLEGKIAEKKSELKFMRNIMSDGSSQVVNVENQIKALEQQLEQERERLSSKGEGVSIGEIMAKYADLKIELELALQAYTSSQISLEKSRVEAYRQVKYLAVVESPTMAEDSAYPEIFYNLTLFAVVFLMLFGIGAIIRSTVKELS